MAGPDLSWFPIYPRDFMSHAAVQVMALDELGAYVKLLFYAWQEGGIPSDERQLAIICGVTPKRMARLWGKVKPCWIASATKPAWLVNPRLEEERVSAWEKYNKRANAGRIGGRTRASNASSNASSTAQATHNSQPTNTVTPNVSNETADAAKWNERLAPFCRALNPDEVGNWLKYWKPLVVNGTDEAEEIMWGLRWLIDKGQLEYMGISKGGVCKPSILKSPRADILKTNALEAYNRHAPNPGRDVVRKLTAI